MIEVLRGANVYGQADYIRAMRTLYCAHIWAAVLFFWGCVGLRMMCSVVLEVLRCFVAVHV